MYKTLLYAKTAARTRIKERAATTLGALPGGGSGGQVARL